MAKRGSTVAEGRREPRGDRGSVGSTGHRRRISKTGGRRRGVPTVSLEQDGVSHRAAISIERDPVRGWITARAVGLTTVQDVVTMITTARASVATRMLPMIFDAREASGSMSPAEVGQVVAALQTALTIGGRRGHAAIVVSDRAIYQAMLGFERRCAAVGMTWVRAFSELPDAERWLSILSASRDLQ